MNKQADPLITHFESNLAETRRRAQEHGLGEADVRAPYFEKIRASLVLREQLVHGELGPSPDYLRAQMEENSRRLLELAIVPAPCGLAEPDTERTWRFNWRRGVTCVLVAGLGTVFCYWIGVLNAASCIALVLLSGLAIMDPSPIRCGLIAAVSVWRRFRQTRKRQQECRALNAEIRRLKHEREAAILRRAQADAWIATREQFLRAEYEVQRIRAVRVAHRLRIPVLTEETSMNGGSHETFQEYAVR